MQVHKELGCGLLEQCYHNALYFELKEAGFQVRYNAPYEVKYKGNTVGEYIADLVVDSKIILELKSVRQLAEAHQAQLINYLHISGCRVGYLLNFQSNRFEFRRLVV